ncbi:3652_t:CDS:1, partial [Dentiscutata heterogama]
QFDQFDQFDRGQVTLLATDNQSDQFDHGQISRTGQFSSFISFS